MSHHASRFTALGLAIFAIACGDANPTRPTRATLPAAPGNPPLANAAVAGGIWADSVISTVADDAQWGAFLPQVWNGDVVYYVHGFVAPQFPVRLPSPDIAPLRDALGAMGYAVAYSSFTENGYSFDDGLRRTHQLRGLVTSRFGRPKRAFLIGHSLGGQITQALAETFPEQYDGALAMCGVVGGTRMETQYIGQLRTVFDFFYPGVLPGNTIAMPPIADVNAQIVGPALAAIQANPTGFGAIARIDQTALAGRNVNEQLTTLLRVLALHALEANDLTGRTHGHTVFDNGQTVYTSSALPPPLVAALNAGVSRYTATRDAEEWLEHNYQPTGRLRIPMLTVHKRWDWLVPFPHEAAYAQIVAAAGSSAMLRQRTVDDYGHCEFSGQTTIGSFLELVQWVTTGAGH